jgi:hypothetical protein
MTIIPICPNARKGTCERSDPVVLSEDSEYYQFGCRTCHCGYVVTAPKGVARARFTNELERNKRQYAMSEADRRAFFGPPQKGWAA